MLVFQVRFMNLSNLVAIRERVGSVAWMLMMRSISRLVWTQWVCGNIETKGLVPFLGGQKQRAVIARMFASDPDIFILDEPTTGMDAGSKNEFYELMHHSAHHHGKAVLMITPRSWRSQGLRRSQYSPGPRPRFPMALLQCPWKWPGGGACLIYCLMILCSGPFWLLLHESLFTSSGDLPYLASSEFDEWYPQPRLAFGCSLWSGTRDFSDYFYYRHCLDCGGLSGVSPYGLQELYGNRDSYPHVNRSGCFSNCHEQG